MKYRCEESISSWWTANPDPVVVAKMARALLYVYLGAFILLPACPASPLPVPRRSLSAIEAFCGVAKQSRNCFGVLSQNLQVLFKPILQLPTFLYLFPKTCFGFSWVFCQHLYKYNCSQSKHVFPPFWPTFLTISSMKPTFPSTAVSTMELFLDASFCDSNPKGIRVSNGESEKSESSVDH